MILDSVDFENEDVVITDPCNVIRYEDWEDIFSGVDKAADGFKILGFKKVISESDFLGVLRCEIFKADGEKIRLGKFKAATVVVLSLSEVKKYNPDYDYKDNEKIGCAAIIRNFTGRVSIERVDDRTISVVGQGNVDFHSKITEDNTNYDEFR